MKTSERESELSEVSQYNESGDDDYGYGYNSAPLHLLAVLFPSNRLGVLHVSHFLATALSMSCTFVVDGRALSETHQLRSRAPGTILFLLFEFSLSTKHNIHPDPARSHLKEVTP